MAGRFVNNSMLNCPLCGSDVIDHETDVELRRCEDVECPAHEIPLKVFVDPVDGIVFLTETV